MTNRVIFFVAHLILVITEVPLRVSSKWSRPVHNSLMHKKVEDNNRESDMALTSQLLETLLDNYDSTQRPWHGGTPSFEAMRPTSVTANMLIRSMGPISELDMEYSMDCYFRQRWTDQRLKFNGTINPISLHIKMLERIWKPDTYFHNGKGSYLHTITQPNKLLRIFRNGDVLYSMRLTIKARCPMQLQSFPMDRQSCPLTFGSYGYTADQLVYKWDSTLPVDLIPGLALSQFDLINYPYRNSTYIFNNGLFSVLHVNFNLQRHMGYFLIQVYVPCILIVVLSWVSFWINREATADRVGLGITTVLTLSTFGLDTRTDLPKVPYPTSLDWFVIMCFSFVIFTLLEFAGVHYFTKVGSGEFPLTDEEGEAVEEEGMAGDSDVEEEENVDLFVPLTSIEECSCRIRRDCDHVVETEPVSHRGAGRFVGYAAPPPPPPPPSRLKHRVRPLHEDERLHGGLRRGSRRHHHRRRQHCCSQFINCMLGNERYRDEMRRRADRGATVNSVSQIDRVSRVLFPCSFIVINLFYWFSSGRDRPAGWEVQNNA
ncbi:gamma-aminobutyric acid receptor subunit alpha-2 [Rhipicephalus microplus]|uniref:gamma-aminobutyric acid receptor subunit alpha-2 n=1 Tax=Rhipicephalus microplus TaxID=6941 RepID=UPI003F6C38EA